VLYRKVRLVMNLKELYVFHIHALRNIYTFVVNPQMHTDNMCFIIC